MNEQIINWLKTYANRRMLVVFMLGFSSGLPLALVGGTLQAWFMTDGASLMMIGAMTLIGQPYTLKWIWAPFLDKFSLTKRLDRRRGWMLLMQLAIIGVIVLMSLSNPHVKLLGFPVLLIFGFLLSFLSATQDIAIDAYRVEVLKSDERGLGAALGVEGYRVAMIASGGFALFLADTYGWQITYLVMAGIMTIGLLATAIAPKVSQPAKEEKSDLLTLTIDSFKDFLLRNKAWSFLLLIAIYKLSDAFAHVYTTPLLYSLDFSLTEVGFINKIVGMIASPVGILVGGLLMTRIGLFKALFTFGLLSGVTNLVYMILTITGKNMVLAASGVFIENICAGMGTAAFVALIMSLCNSKYSATQFALLTSLAAFARIYVGPISGKLLENLGYTNFYLFTAFIAIPSLLLLGHLRQAIESCDFNKDKQNTSTNESDGITAAALS